MWRNLTDPQPRGRWVAPAPAAASSGRNGAKIGVATAGSAVRKPLLPVIDLSGAATLTPARASRRGSRIEAQSVRG